MGLDLHRQWLSVENKANQVPIHFLLLGKTIVLSTHVWLSKEVSFPILT